MRLLANRLIRSLFFVVFLLSGQLVWAQLAKIGDDTLVNPDYEPRGRVVELLAPKAKDQGMAEECFLFAYTTELETSLYNSPETLDLHPTEAGRLSVPYLLARKIQYHVEQTLTHGKSSTDLRGGQIYDAIAIAHLYGVVPESAWSPKIKYSEWPMDQLYETIGKKLKSWKAKLERLKESDGESSRTYRQELKSAKDDTLQELWAVTGTLPTQVSFQGKLYTPRQLSRRLGADRRKEIRMMYPAKKWAEPELNYFSQQLDWITQSMNGAYLLTPQTWSDTLAQIQKNIDSRTASLLGTSWGRGGHVMTIIGYELEEGEVTHLKAINSWGPDWGKNGAAWFEAKDIGKKYDQIWWFEN